MKSKTEFDLLTPKEIDIEIGLRKEMLKQLGGWLYTSIMESEIQVLIDRKEHLKKHVNVEAFEKIKQNHFKG